MRLIVFGTRTFNRYLFMVNKLDVILSNTPKHEIEIVCGEADGADALGKLYAQQRGYRVKSFPADWGKYGRAAGPIRNEAMACYGTHAAGFWDGRSRGTADMIKRARAHKLPTRIILYE